MIWLRWLLFPFTILYMIIIWTRNRLYDHHILKSKSFDFPTIVIGNLAIGGTGKSPMTEFLIRLLKDKHTFATLSRGYGRKTKGFRYVSESSSAEEVGDEPLQFKRKFPTVTVSVSEDRCFGVEQLKATHDIILLDDAFQHRKLQPSFSILLFDYRSIDKLPLLLPTGNYRDMMMESHRADVLIVTKSPAEIPPDERYNIEKRLRKHNQTAPIYFTHIQYNKCIDVKGRLFTGDLSDTDVLLITGIANPAPLIQYLSPLVNRLVHMPFADHHTFSSLDIQKIEEMYKGITNTKKIFLTTEKDFQRLDYTPLHQYPFYYIPIEIGFEEGCQHILETRIFDHINEYIPSK